jgi:hypothetical protein
VKLHFALQLLNRVTYNARHTTALTVRFTAHTTAALQHTYTHSRPLSLDMRTADDKTAALRVWRVNSAVKGRPLSELHRTSDAGYGVFSSADAYVVLHSSKNGTRHAIYLWVGSDAAVATKAALTIQVGYLFFIPLVVCLKILFH